MSVDVLAMFESLAEHGTAPEEGCSLFSVGYESFFEKLEAKYLVERFGRGGSAEKFVIGPNGSGKTHFLRQLMEIARERDCVTAEVKLNKKLDYSAGLEVYQEIVRQLRAPNEASHGLRSVIIEAIKLIRARAESKGVPPDVLLDAWVSAISQQDFAFPAFGRVMQRAIRDHLRGEAESFDTCLRWLGGEVTDSVLARAVGQSVIPSSGLRIYAHNARLSLYRFIRNAGFAGTIIGFDEAEQGISTDKKKMAKIFSHLLAEVNAIVDLKDASVLIVYAVTKDIMDKIDTEMPMLRQRLADPGAGQGFFDGNIFAPRIDLTQRPHAVEELSRMGDRLVTLFFERVSDADQTRRPEALAAVRGWAEAVEREEPSSSARREMVRRTCTPLVNGFRLGGPTNGGSPASPREPEV
jgi:P-loop Domain of unknown function (DUF2791)